MKKEKMMKKERKKRNVAGYCPFLACTGSRYSSCIVTQKLGGWPGRSLGATTWSSWRAARPAIRPQQRPRYGRERARHSRQRARPWPGWWIVSRYTVLYRDRGEGLAAGGGVSRYSLCIMTSGQSGCRRVTIQSIVS